MYCNKILIKNDLSDCFQSVYIFCVCLIIFCLLFLFKLFKLNKTETIRSTSSYINNPIQFTIKIAIIVFYILQLTQNYLNLHIHYLYIYLSIELITWLLSLCVSLFHYHTYQYQCILNKYFWIFDLLISLKRLETQLLQPIDDILFILTIISLLCNIIMFYYALQIKVTSSSLLYTDNNYTQSLLSTRSSINQLPSNQNDQEIWSNFMNVSSKSSIIIKQKPISFPKKLSLKLLLLNHNCQIMIANYTRNSSSRS